jgi:hypothetical protein
MKIFDGIGPRHGCRKLNKLLPHYPQIPPDCPWEDLKVTVNTDSLGTPIEVEINDKLVEFNCN